MDSQTVLGKMDSQTVLGVIVFIIFLAVIIYISIKRDEKKENSLTQEGAIVKRPDGFWEARFVYTAANADPSTVVPAISQISHTTTKLRKIAPDSTGQSVRFKSSTYTAELDYAGVRDGKCIWSFDFDSFDTNAGRPPKQLEMNALLTGVEQVFLAIDPQTSVAQQQKSMKRRVKFF